jgi:hypothetical protein
MVYPHHLQEQGAQSQEGPSHSTSPSNEGQHSRGHGLPLPDFPYTYHFPFVFWPLLCSSPLASSSHLHAQLHGAELRACNPCA